MVKNIFFSFFVLSLFMLTIFIKYQWVMPYAYYFLAFVIGMLLIIMIYRSNDKKQRRLFLSIAMLCIFLRSIYLIASGFSLVPLSDGYAGYAVSKVFLENGQSNVISESVGHTISYQSGWPSLHILAVSLSLILNVDILYVVLALPLIFSLVILAFIYLLMREIVPKLGLSHKVVPLALFLYTISSDNIYSSMQFTRQSFGIVFIMIIFYLLCKLRMPVYEAKQVRIKPIFLIFLLTLVSVHEFSPFTMLLFFFLFLILTHIGNYCLARVRWKISSTPSHSISLPTLALFSATMFTWWMYHSPMVLAVYIPFLEGGFQFSLYVHQQVMASVRWSFYPVLRPEPYANLLVLSYIVLYVSLVIGFLAFIKKMVSRKKITAEEQFLVYSVTAFFALFVVFEFFLSLQPMRLLWFAAPFIALFTALLYDRLFAMKKALWRILAVSLLIMVVFSTFLAPWSRGYMPLYVYEPSVRFEDVGSHNPLYRNVAPFVRNYVRNENFERFLSDDLSLLYIILPSESYYKTRDVYYNPEMINDTRVILFEFLHLNPNFHALPYFPLYSDVLDHLESFKHQIAFKFNVVYDDGYSKIRISADQSQT